MERNEHVDDLLYEQIREMRLFLAGILFLWICKDIVECLCRSRRTST